jgi:hypothetical protein
MDNSNLTPAGKPKKSSSKFKLILYALALIGLVWVGFQGSWAWFQFRAWLRGFGTGAFWVTGLIAGFVYFHSVHRIYERIKEMSSGAKKIGSYTAFSLGLLVVNPLPISLAIWVLLPPGSLNTIGHWFFLGCAVAGGIVLILERLFAKKKSKP